MRLERILLKEYEKMENGLLEIGDIIITEHIHMKIKNIYEIDSVSKTIGKCNCGNYIQRFNREINWIHTVPREQWDCLNYRVYRKIVLA